MKRILFLGLIAVLCAFGLRTSFGADSVQSKDWLVDPSPYVSDVVYDDAKHELKLTNGLVERRILLAPNAATVSLRNLKTGEEYVRALAPEARVTLDGEPYPVGGLTGGPVANYWREEWAKDAKALDYSYQYVRYEVGEIEERFAYKPRPEWLSRDVQWPPKGKRVSMFYAPPKFRAPVSAGEVLFEEPFLKTLDPSWKVFTSDKGDRVSVVNEGKPGEIYAFADVCAYLEREWAPGAAALQVTLDVGDETYSNSWGPGAALLFGDDREKPSKVVSVVARPNSLQYELCVDGKETLVGKFDREGDVRLTLRLTKNAEDASSPYTITIDGVDKNGVRTQIGTVDAPSEPKFMRVGKVGKGGYGKDYPNPGTATYTRVHLKNVSVYGPVSEEKAAEVKLPEVEVRYEIYDGAPLTSKRIYVRNASDDAEGKYLLNTFVNEELRLVEAESVVDDYKPVASYNLSVFSDHVYLGMSETALNDNKAVQLRIDRDYPTQVNYLRQTLCLLVCTPELGPAQYVSADKEFASNTIYELLYDGTDRERRGLSSRRAMRILAPWTMENPLMFHKVKSSPEEVRDGIEQCRETGFEVFIMSFGSGFNLESKDKKYHELYHGLSKEATAAGVALGGYSLTSSRGAATKSDNVQNPSPRFGQGPCLQSAWGQDYLQTLKDFMADAEFGVFENDGPYPGDYCESTEHPGHRGKEDSVWTQRQAQAELYHWCRARGIYVNQPDGYFLDGGNKTGMGYRETNWSLPRAEQVVIERQNVYDGTWTKLPSQGWMFVPLSQYHGGGAAATIEPLKDHLEHYDARFADLIGAGVQACWRGPRLYDSEETKKVVCKWTKFYKENRRILDSDIIHMRRATGRDWDGILHVDPDVKSKTRALAFFYNPTLEPITRTIDVPLYYSGLSGKAVVRFGNSDLELGEPFEVELNEKNAASIEVVIPAEKYMFVTFEESK